MKNEAGKKVNKNIYLILSIIFAIFTLLMILWNFFSICETKKAAAFEATSAKSKIDESMLTLEGKMAGEMQENLKIISEYLDQLDQSVTQNKEEVLSLAIEETDIDSVQNHLLDLRKTIAKVMEQFENFKHEYMDNRDYATQEIDNIILNIEDIQSNINQIRLEISKGYNQLETGDIDRSDSIKDSIHKLSAKIGKDIKEINKNITDLIKELKNAGDEQNDILIKQLMSNHDALLQALFISNGEINSVIETAGKNIQKEISDVNEGIVQLYAELISSSMKIEEAQDSIQHTLEDMNSSITNEVVENFNVLYDLLNKINDDMSKTHDKLEAIIKSVIETQGENQKDLLAALRNIDSSLTTQNNNNFKNIINSFQVQAQNIETEFQAMGQRLNQNFTDLSSAVITSKEDTITSITDNINNKFLTLSDFTSNNKEEVIQRISQMEENVNTKYSKIEGDLRSVFQSVNNGKKLLASALFTKNVSVSGDAAFKDIYNAILSIDQKITIGVDQIPGTISYTYHYHTGDTINGGGCFTKKLYHQHSPSCYTTGTCRPVCLGLTSGEKVDNWIYHYDSRFLHADCGSGITYSNPRHRDGEGCNCGYIEPHKYSYLSCGKNNSTFDRWDVGCGFVDGQIIGATIIYDESYHNMKLAGAPEKEIGNYIPPVDIQFPTTPQHSDEGDTRTSNTEEMEDSEKECETETEDKSETETETKCEIETESNCETETEKFFETKTEDSTESVSEVETDYTDTEEINK